MVYKKLYMSGSKNLAYRYTTAQVVSYKISEKGEQDYSRPLIG